jgi:membrane-bound lytic murein transglycosylase D
VPKAVVAAPAPAPSSGGHRTRHYRVRAGDTLIGIVHRMRCSSVRDVVQVNQLQGHQIHPGQVLKLTGCR